MQFYSRSNLSILACVVAVWGAFPFAVLAQDATAAKPKQHVAVGLQKQLLVDDFVIAEKHNVARALGKVTKHGIVMKPTLPTDFIPPAGQRNDEGYEDNLKTGKKPI